MRHILAYIRIEKAYSSSVLCSFCTGSMESVYLSGSIWQKQVYCIFMCSMCVCKDECFYACGCSGYLMINGLARVRCFCHPNTHSILQCKNTFMQEGKPREDTAQGRVCW
ncbi:uncharacterized protein NESG_02277 [Nematocida ausubeli]|uniref:Uncharacterized protein n=1 Tax=Nematocida ausubeli (strain ATCC PRA-371 / ERTm2) TaxID=1913371 RepID=A0A086J033_NEMA1|nr:uncharacterized protein NESG_02277 [Nematocida ausubeli]KFG25501.1 hypothetical protein NESG_02277 [Nematocida ausubeli]